MSASQVHRSVACIRLIGYAGQAGITDAEDLERKCAERFLVIRDISSRHNGNAHQQEADRIVLSFTAADDSFWALTEIFIRNIGSGIPYSAGVSHGAADISGDELKGTAAERSASLLRQATTAMIAVDEEFAGALSEEQCGLLKETRLQFTHNDQKNLAILELPWPDLSVTTMPRLGSTKLMENNEDSSPALSGRKLTLSFADQNVSLDKPGQRLIIGRSDKCDIVIKNESASRQHAVIEQTEAGFQLTDESMNGTYVSAGAGKTIPVHNSSAPLSGSGEIYIGRLPTDKDSITIKFRIE